MSIKWLNQKLCWVINSFHAKFFHKHSTAWFVAWICLIDIAISILHQTFLIPFVNGLCSDLVAITVRIFWLRRLFHYYLDSLSQHHHHHKSITITTDFSTVQSLHCDCAHYDRQQQQFATLIQQIQDMRGRCMAVNDLFLTLMPTFKSSLDGLLSLLLEEHAKHRNLSK